MEKLDRAKIKEKAVHLSFAARAVIQQLALEDGSPEAKAARDLLETAMTKAIPDGLHQPELTERAA